MCKGTVTKDLTRGWPSISRVLLNLRFAHENDNQKGASGQLINHYLNLFSSTLLTFYTLPNIAQPQYVYHLATKCVYLTTCHIICVQKKRRNLAEKVKVWWTVTSRTVGANFIYLILFYKMSLNCIFKCRISQARTFYVRKAPLKHEIVPYIIVILINVSKSDRSSFPCANLSSNRSATCNPQDQCQTAGRPL